MKTEVTIPENISSEHLCFVRPDGQFRELTSLCEIFGDEVVKAANIELLKSFGCTEEACFLDTTAKDPNKAPRVSQLQQAWEFLKAISLASTLSPWGPNEEGDSGISSKALRAKVDLTPGAILALSGLMRVHPHAAASGELNISFNNPKRGRR